MDALNDIGKAVLSVLQSTFASTIYELWFQDLKLVSLSENEAVFQINNSFKQKRGGGRIQYSDLCYEKGARARAD